MKENTQEKSLQVINDRNNIIHKIKEFFTKIFNRNKKATAEHNLSSQKIQDDERKVFIKSLNTDSSLIELQKKLKIGEITIQNLSLEEKEEMINLYRKQIEYKKDKLNNINKKILFYRKSFTKN